MNAVNEDERLRILKMVEEGKVSADQGIEILKALGGGRKPGYTERQAASDGPRWFRIRVTDLETGKGKTNVTIPISLMDWGLKIGARFSPADLDLEELHEMLRSGAEGKIVDVVDEEDGERVEIYVD